MRIDAVDFRLNKSRIETTSCVMTSKGNSFYNMNTILIITLIAATGISVASGGANILKCKGMDMKVHEQDRTWVADCMKEVNANTPEEAMKNPCFRKCIVMKRGFADDKGMGSKEKAAEFVKMTAPDAVHGVIVPKAEKCVDTYAGGIKDAGMTCESYVPLCQCMGDIYTETCM